MTHTALPRIAVTAGEPAGIGPELCVQLAQCDLDCELLVIADPRLLLQRADMLGLPLTVRPFDADRGVQKHRPGQVSVLPVALRQPSRCGQLEVANSRYVLESIRMATEGCLEGKFSAMVTAPVHKGIINDAGIGFSGHTEFIAALCDCRTPLMMLACEGLRVALATTHLPLAEVSAAITAPLLRQVIGILDADLRRYFRIARPRILVCGLNPHAGEGGYLGREEIDIIEPLLSAMRDQGLDLLGPLPADTLFTAKYLDQADAVLAMYHDQGLPVLKYKGFGQAANITLGLPIIRTSVDHGTALELAGTGRANLGSLLFALHAAIEMAGQ